MEKIKKVAVIGSGVMGASIASHIANSDTEVLLLDIVPKNAKDRSILAKNALGEILEKSSIYLLNKSKADNIKVGNLEDDLGLLKDVDWIIEVVIENVDIKRELYKKLFDIKSSTTIISSNTSTIMLKDLVEGFPLDFKRHFMITHFFNPPRYMKLFELVASSDVDVTSIEKIRNFVDIKLGKGIVECKDTAGFIANRIGFYWINTALYEAFNYNLSVEEVDTVMSQPLGIPKTGVFGLMDLIGIDLIPLIGKSFINSLSDKDSFVREYFEPELMINMIKEGYIGRKGKGGFYLFKKEDGKKTILSKDLKTGDYKQLKVVDSKFTELSKKSLTSLLECPDNLGKYTKAVLLKLFAYTASLIPEISDDIRSVDDAMKWGYNWNYGPFEIIDLLSNDKIMGVDWVIKELEYNSIEVPLILKKSQGKKLYKKNNMQSYQVTLDGSYTLINKPLGVWNLSDKKGLKNNAVLQNNSSAVWDIGDGVLCLEYYSKMNSIDTEILDITSETIKLISNSNSYKGLVIGNDSSNFSVGANISLFLDMIKNLAWDAVENFVKKGQNTYMEMKYAPFPVVSASYGMAIGGGCEVLLHSDAIVAHVETYTGLVETGVGVIPGWGGCKEMLLRCSYLPPEKQEEMVLKLLSFIMSRKISSSAEEAKTMLILKDTDKIIMNRDRLLDNAKSLCLKLSTSYKVRKKTPIKFPSISKKLFDNFIEDFIKKENISEYSKVILEYLVDIFSVGFLKEGNELEEDYLLSLESEAFMKLVKNKETYERIEYMLKNGKALNN